MWHSMGVYRDRRHLLDAAESIDTWCQYVLGQQFSDPAGWELQNMLTVARVMVRGALVREESRGVHLRSDFPESIGAWRKHLAVKRGDPQFTEQIVE